MDVNFPGPGMSSKTTDSSNKHGTATGTSLFSDHNDNTPSSAQETNPVFTSDMTPNATRSLRQSCCTGGVKMPIAGVDIEFPFQPYPTQIYMMNQVLRAIKKAEHCLLESPTGTGKTMALLCACLAWQQQEKRLQEIKKEEIRIKKEEDRIKQIDMIKKGEDRELINDDIQEVKVPIAREYEYSYDSDCSDDDDIFVPKRKKCISGFGKSNDKLNEIESVKESRDEPENSFIKHIKEEDPEDDDLWVPQIYYGTRTHKQVAQVIEQLKGSPYAKNVKMTILASREHTCVNKLVQGKPNVTELCKAAIDPANRGGCCSYFVGVAKNSNFKCLSNYGLPTVYDIEDMVYLGKKKTICPYFTLHGLVDEADIIIGPYNYLVDPKVRKSMQIFLDRNIVIMDEAHNIEDNCREVGGLLLKQVDLEEAMQECSDNIYQSENEIEYRIIGDYLRKLHSWLDTNGPYVQYSNMNESKTTMSGQELVNTLYASSITQEEYAVFKNQFIIIEEQKAGNPDQNFGVTGKVKRISSDIMLALDYLYNPQNTNKYQAYMSRDIGSRKFGQLKKNEWLRKPTRQEGLVELVEAKQWTYSLHLVCLTPAIVFSELLRARTIVLASGTLSPLDSFQTELSVKFPWVVKGRHVVPGQNLFVSTVSSGPQHIELRGTFEHVNKYEYQDELGRTILETSRAVPHGVLCFFPSYSLMDKLQQRWTSTGLLQQLSEIKEIFWEPRSKLDMNTVMTNFTERIEMSMESPDTENGAILFGVFRGKIAEGIDFSDEKARVVIAVGIPYQNRFTNSINLKIKFNDENASDHLINGNRWYRIQAFRALNQALGRCIRHKNDWGAVILLDSRFTNKEVQDNIPTWIQQQLQNYQSWNTYIENITAFCEKMKKT